MHLFIVYWPLNPSSDCEALSTFFRWDSKCQFQSPRNTLTSPSPFLIWFGLSGLEQEEWMCRDLGEPLDGLRWVAGRRAVDRDWPGCSEAGQRPQHEAAAVLVSSQWAGAVLPHERPGRRAPSMPAQARGLSSLLESADSQMHSRSSSLSDRNLWDQYAIYGA